MLAMRSISTRVAKNSEVTVSNDATKTMIMPSVHEHGCDRFSLSIYLGHACVSDVLQYIE